MPVQEQEQGLVQGMYATLQWKVLTHVHGVCMGQGQELL